MRRSATRRAPQLRKNSWVLAVLAVLAVTLLAPAASEAGQATGEQTPREVVAALLERRAAAVREGDREAFLATVDPRAPAPFREAQARSFDGIRSVPFERYRLEASTEHTGDLTPPGLRERYGGARTYLPETTQRYRLRGYDNRDALDTLWVTYVERGGRWYVGGDTDLVDVGLETHREIWDLGPVRLASTDHFIVVSHPDTADRADDLARLAEEALVRLRGVWDRPWSERIPVILPSSADELEVILQSTFDLDDFVAFVGFGIDARDGWEVGAPRLYVQDENLAEHSDSFQIETLVHEYVHAATAPDSGPFIDTWVTEGLADWVAKGRDTGEGLPSSSDGILPESYEFRTGGSGTILTSYAESRSAMAHLAAGRGLAAPADLYRRLGSARLEPGSIDYQVDQALGTVAGTARAGFEAAWAG